MKLTAGTASSDIEIKFALYQKRQSDWSLDSRSEQLDDCLFSLRTNLGLNVCLNNYF